MGLFFLPAVTEHLADKHKQLCTIKKKKLHIFKLQMHSCEIQEKAVQFSLANLWIHEVTLLWLVYDMIAGFFPTHPAFFYLSTILGNKAIIFGLFITT